MNVFSTEKINMFICFLTTNNTGSTAVCTIKPNLYNYSRKSHNNLLWLPTNWNKRCWTLSFFFSSPLETPRLYKAYRRIIRLAELNHYLPLSIFINIYIFFRNQFFQWINWDWLWNFFPSIYFFPKRLKTSFSCFACVWINSWYKLIFTLKELVLGLRWLVHIFWSQLKNNFSNNCINFITEK